MFNQFNSILKTWAQETVKKNPQVVSIIQFGSTCQQPIKKQTDIDLIYIIDSEKNRIAKIVLN